MKTLQVLFVVLCLLFSTSTFSDCETLGDFEQLIVTAMEAEAVGMGVISALPFPPPSPKAYKNEFRIADTFSQIGENVMAIRSLSLVSGLPFPPPSQGGVSWLPYPPPKVLLSKAKQILSRTEALLELTELQIERAFDAGNMTSTDYDTLLGLVQQLDDQISGLPFPPPYDDDPPGT